MAAVMRSGPGRRLLVRSTALALTLVASACAHGNSPARGSSSAISVGTENVQVTGRSTAGPTPSQAPSVTAADGGAPLARQMAIAGLDAGAAGSLGTAAASAPTPTTASSTADAILSAQVSTGSAPASPAGWGSPVLVENFDGVLNTSKWNVYNSPTADKLPRRASNTSVSGGSLRLAGSYDAAGRNISSGVANTVNQLYGRWEVRFRVEAGAGYSAVALLWPRTDKWPTDGEVDLFQIGSADRATAGAFVHNGPDNNSTGYTIKADFTKWHTVAVEWLPYRLTYFLDNQPVWTVSKSTAGGNLIPSTSPMHLALQLDAGCAGGVTCREASTPARVNMYVDQVRVWAAPPGLIG